MRWSARRDRFVVLTGLGGRPAPARLPPLGLGGKNRVGCSSIVAIVLSPIGQFAVRPGGWLGVVQGG